jgi:hypothetical protein
VPRCITNFENRALVLTENAASTMVRAHDEPDHHLRHLPGDYELATPLAWPSFSQNVRPTDARPAGPKAYNSIRSNPISMQWT